MAERDRSDQLHVLAGWNASLEVLFQKGIRQGDVPAYDLPDDRTGSSNRPSDAVW
jgi:hypothetical protein